MKTSFVLLGPSYEYLLTYPPGQVLRVVRVEDQVLSLVRARYRRRTLRADLHTGKVHRVRRGFRVTVSKFFR